MDTPLSIRVGGNYFLSNYSILSQHAKSFSSSLILRMDITFEKTTFLCFGMFPGNQSIIEWD